MIAARIVGLLFVLLTAACAGPQHARPGEPPPSGATQAGTVAVETKVAPAAPSVSHSAAQVAADAKPPAQPAEPQRAQLAELSPTGATQAETAAAETKTSPAAPSVTLPAGRLAAKAKSPAKPVASPVPAEQIPKKEIAAPSPAKQGTAPPLDLKSLETRLKETKAIGVFTKLALKNQVDDLLDKFRAFYQGRLKTTLPELRRPYDMLILKVLALLQDSDPPLAHEIVTSREAIWSILADPAKFANI